MDSASSPRSAASRRQVRPVTVLVLGHSASRKRVENWVFPRRRSDLEVADFRFGVLYRNFVDDRLLDAHNVRFADIAEPFLISYVREIYAKNEFSVSILREGSLSACLKWVTALVYFMRPSGIATQIIKKVDHLPGSMIGQKKSYVYPWVDALVCIASYLRFLELFGLTRDCSL